MQWHTTPQPFCDPLRLPHDSFAVFCFRFAMYHILIPVILIIQPMHYGEVEKNGWKWSTLRAFFSAVCSENTCKKLLNAVLTPQESMKNLVLKKLKQKMVKKAKKPVAHVC